MRYSAEHKQETRTRVIAAAGQVFRKEGYGGAGIDALTKAAGVTNGAFYGHFKSKGEAFRTAVLTGLEELRQGIAALKARQPKDCLPSLSPDVMRADDETRSAYTAELKRLIEEVAVGLPEGEIPGQSETRREDQAILLLAMLSGGVTLARAASDPALSKRIADVIAQAALTAIEPGN